MAKKNKKGKQYSTAFIKRIWSQIDINDWYNLVRNAFPSSRWTCSRNMIKGQCPFHQDRTPSFFINLDKGYAKCYSSDCGIFFWDPVRFYMRLQGNTASYGRALMDMKSRYNLDISKTFIGEIKKHQRHRDMKQLLFRVMQGELIDAHSQRKANVQDPDLLYTKDVLAYLDQRNISPVYHLLPIGVYPPTCRLEKLVNQLLPQMGKHMRGIWDDIKVYLNLDNRSINWVGSLVMFTGVSPEDVARIKLRRVPPANSATHTITSKDMMYIPDTYDHENGVFGLFGTPLYSHYFESDSVRSFHYMEGEFDALSIMSEQFDRSDIKFFAFSGGGSSAQGLDTLVPFGFDTGYVVGDYDNEGNAWVGKILERTVTVVPRVFIWPVSLLTKKSDGTFVETDPDGVIQICGHDIVFKELCTESNFIKPYQWATKHATSAMNDIAPDDIRFLTSTAAEWGKYVRDISEQQAYAAAISNQFTINTGQVLSAIKAENDTVDVFIDRIKEHLSHRLHVLEIRRAGHNAQLIRAYDSVSKRVYDIPLEEKTKIMAVIGAMTGKDPLKFIREEVGTPSFMDVEDDTDEQVYLTLTDKCANFIKLAVTRLAGCVVDKTDRKLLGAGIHCLAPNIDKPDEVFRLYCVNGLNLLRGDFEPGGSLIWRDLPGPSDDHVVVHIKEGQPPKTFMPQIKCAADMNAEAPYTDVKELFDIVYSIIDCGWDFKNHKITCELLTAFCLMLPITACVDRKPLIMVTSETSGGKSSLIGGLIGRKNLQRINVVQASQYVDTYTIAGLKQLVNNTSLCMCVDEFEDGGGDGRDKMSMTRNGVLRMLRGHANEAGGGVQGSTSGQYCEYNLDCAFIFAGTRGLQDPVDINRFIIIKMDRKDGRDAPEEVISREIGEKVVTNVRLSLMSTMARKAKLFYESYHRIMREYSSGGGLEYGKITRSLKHFYGFMAILDICGRDYHQFIRTYYREHRAQFEELTQMTLSSDLLEELLYTPAIQLNNNMDTRLRSLNEILTQEDPETLNESSSGIFYDSKTKWIVVQWQTVLGGQKILKSLEFRNRKALALKNTAAQSKYFVPERTVQQEGVLERLSLYIGNATFRHNISVFNVSNIIADAGKSIHQRARGKEDLDIYTAYASELKNIKFPTPSSLQNNKVSETEVSDSDGDNDGDEELD